MAGGLQRWECLWVKRIHDIIKAYGPISITSIGRFCDLKKEHRQTVITLLIYMGVVSKTRVRRKGDLVLYQITEHKKSDG